MNNGLKYVCSWRKAIVWLQKTWNIGQSHIIWIFYDVFFYFWIKNSNCIKKEWPNFSVHVPQKKDIRFTATWGWVNEDRTFIFEWTVPWNIYSGAQTPGNFILKQKYAFIYSYADLASDKRRTSNGVYSIIAIQLFLQPQFPKFLYWIHYAT